MSALAEIGRVRRQQVVNLSVTELMLLLVFMSITFSFLAKEEGQFEVPYLQKRVLELEEQNKKLASKIVELERSIAQIAVERDEARKRIEELEFTLKALAPIARAPSPGEGPSRVISEAQLNALLAQIDLLTKLVDRQKGEIALLGKEMETKTGKAPGKPICLVTSGSLVRITFLPDGSFRGAPAWDVAASREAMKIDGVDALTSGAILSETQFRAAGDALVAWADKLDQPCRFYGLIERETTDVAVYERQLMVFEQYFYKGRGR